MMVCDWVPVTARGHCPPQADSSLIVRPKSSLTSYRGQAFFGYIFSKTKYVKI